MSFINKAAYIIGAKVRPFEIRLAPVGVPGENQILIKNHALAVNPIDGKIQYRAIFALQYPTILGSDVAGEVVAVGQGITRFKLGDRVLGCSAGFLVKNDTAKAFQSYTILDSNLTSHIPDELTYERAVVLPLGIATAADALYDPNFLHLQLPTCPSRSSTGQSILIWGGASSVGSSAIQLAVASGYEVITTASTKNFDYVRKLGAKVVFDYSSPTIITDLVRVLQGRRLAGAFDVPGDWENVTKVVSHLKDAEGTNKFVATTVPGIPGSANGISLKQVQSMYIRGNFVGKAIFEDFLPVALTSQTVLPAPEPLIVGQGLEALQSGVDAIVQGQSATKIVVRL